MPANGKNECRAVQVARTFFKACTKLSDDDEDILPQEDAVDYKLSVFRLFAELFPEFTNSGKHGLMRLQFNKLGYEIYEKEQSRRVPAVRAKPGNPGYGFRRARWRDPIHDPQDARLCEAMLMGIGVSVQRIERVKKRVNDFLVEWDQVRRPSRPAGPGRPRAPKRGGSFNGAALHDVGLDVAGSMVAIDIEAHAFMACAPGGGAGERCSEHMASDSLWADNLGALSRGPMQGDRLGREHEALPVHAAHRDRDPLGAHYEAEAMRPWDQAAAALPTQIHGRTHGSPGMPLGSGYQYPLDMHAEGFMRMPGREGGGVKGGEYKGGEVRERGHDADRRLAVLFENNQYLRQVNKSLIAQRENLNAEIEQCDLESDELLQMGERILMSSACDNPETEQNIRAFRIVLHGISSTGRSRRGPDRESWQQAMQVIKVICNNYQRLQLGVDVEAQDQDAETQTGPEGPLMHGILRDLGEGVDCMEEHAMRGYGGQGREGVQRVRGVPQVAREADLQQESPGPGHPRANMMMRGADAAARMPKGTTSLPTAYHHAAAAHAHARELQLAGGDLGAPQHDLHGSWDSLPASSQRRPSWGGGFRAAGGQQTGGQASMMMQGGAMMGGVRHGFAGGRAYHESMADAARDAALREYEEAGGGAGYPGVPMAHQYLVGGQQRGRYSTGEHLRMCLPSASVAHQQQQHHKHNLINATSYMATGARGDTTHPDDAIAMQGMRGGGMVGGGRGAGQYSWHGVRDVGQR